MKKENILIIGYGISGKSVASGAKDLGYCVYIYDDNIKTPDRNLSSGFNFISKEEIFDHKYKYIVKSPGIPPDNKVVQDMTLKGLDIISDIEFGYIIKGSSKIISVTGTNGKTTTSILIDKFLKDGGINTDLGGNIGIGGAELLKNSKAEYIVLECSSFQLRDIKIFTPDIGVYTNIESDHLDYHKDITDYRESKLKMIRNIGKNPLVINIDDPVLDSIDKNKYNIYPISGRKILKFGYSYYDGYIYKDGEKILDVKALSLLGVHNYYNIMEAMTVGSIVGVETKTMIESAKSIKGVEHRLEYVDSYKDVGFYNDSKGTNIQSTLHAIDALDDNIIIILGGYDKGEDYTPILNNDKIKYVFAIGQTGDRIISDARKIGLDNVKKWENLEEVFEELTDTITEGDVVLLSPASASWGMYKNFEERGDHFKKLVKDLICSQN